MHGSSSADSMRDVDSMRHVFVQSAASPVWGGGRECRQGVRVTVVDVPDRARFELRIEDELVGYSTYHAADGAVTLPLTEIDPASQGRGLGTILVQGVLTAVRQRQLRVLPYCASVRHYLLTHPGELDLVSAPNRPGFGLPPASPVSE